MGFFDRSSSKNYSTANTAVSEVTFAPTDNRIAGPGSSQGGGAAVGGDVGGAVTIFNNDGSGEAIGLVHESLNNSMQLNTNVIAGAGNVIEGAFGLTSDGIEQAFNFGERALQTVDKTQLQTTDYLTSLTDNVLARDAVQRVAENFDGSANEILRSLNSVGTVGDTKSTEKMFMYAAIGLGVLAIVVFGPQFIKKGAR